MNNVADFNHLSIGRLEKLEKHQPHLIRWFDEFITLKNQCNLKKILPKGIKEHWEILGHGLVIEGIDKDAYQQFFKFVSNEFGIDLVLVTGKDIFNLEEIIDKLNRPNIVLLDGDGWLRRDVEGDDASNLRKKVLRVLDDIQKKPIVIVSLTESYGAIEECFRYSGKFDRHIIWQPPTPKLWAEKFIEIIGPSLLDLNLLDNSTSLGILLCLEFSSLRRLEMLAICLKRKVHKSKEKISWGDIVAVAVQGTGEGFNAHPNTNWEQISIHEAGHAVATILDSGGENIPDFVSILPGKEMLGVMVENYQKNFETSGYSSFAKIRSKIRIYLAGRAAEELILGTNGVGVFSANQDLEDASWIAMNMMSKGGFSSGYGTNKQKKELSLLVAIDKRIPEDSIFFQDQARKFLVSQFKVIKKLLFDNQTFLLTIQAKLVDKKILFQEDLLDIINSSSGIKNKFLLLSNEKN